MSVSPQRARHRAARRPLTPLDDLAQVATGTLALVGRRSAVVCAAGGLVISVALPASAAPADPRTVPAVDVRALTAEARATLTAVPGVAVPVDVAWTFDTPAITVVANPEPEPVVEPEPEPEEEDDERASDAPASRSAARTAPAAEEAPAEEAPAEERAPAASVPASASGSAIIEAAAQFVGVPYVSGGTSPSGFDCSGFTSYVYGLVGISLPRTSGEQRNAGVVVSRDEAQPGDLIFSPGHIGIYAGGNQQIDAPRPGKTIQFREIWQSNPTFVRYTG